MAKLGALLSLRICPLSAIGCACRLAVAAVLAQIAAEYLLGNFQQVWTKALKAHKLSKTARFMEAEPQLKAALCTNVE